MEHVSRDADMKVIVRSETSILKKIMEKKNEGFKLVALEQSDRSVSIFDYKFDRRTVLLVGNEKFGIVDHVLSQFEDIVEIPQYGQPFSLNVAISTGMALYEYCKQFPKG